MSRKPSDIPNREPGKLLYPGPGLSAEDRARIAPAAHVVSLNDNSSALAKIKRVVLEAASPKKSKTEDKTHYAPIGEKAAELRNASTFQALCAAAGQQQSAFFNKPDGCTKTLGILLIEFRKAFDELDDETKDKLGLSGKTAEEITHFDLLEIGLYGKVNTEGKTPGEILIRNENLKHMYLNEHRGHHSQSTLVHMIQRHHAPNAELYRENDPQIDELNQTNLYSKILIVRNTKAGAETGAVLDKVWADEPISKRRVEATSKTADDFFKERMRSAVDQYDKNASSPVRFFWQQRISPEMKGLCQTVREHLKNGEYNEALIAIASEKNLDPNLKQRLKEKGIMTEKGELAITPIQEAPSTVSSKVRG